MAKNVPFNEATREGDLLSVHLVKRAEHPQAREFRFHYYLKDGQWIPTVPGYNPIKHIDDEKALLKAVVAEVDAKDANPTMVAQQVKPVSTKKKAAAKKPADPAAEEYAAKLQAARTSPVVAQRGEFCITAPAGTNILFVCKLFQGKPANKSPWMTYTSEGGRWICDLGEGAYDFPHNDSPEETYTTILGHAEESMAIAYEGAVKDEVLVAREERYWEGRGSYHEDPSTGMQD